MSKYFDPTDVIMDFKYQGFNIIWNPVNSSLVLINPDRLAETMIAVESETQLVNAVETLINTIENSE